MKKLNLNNLYESPYPPTDTKILWVDKDESTGDIRVILRYNHTTNVWKPYLRSAAYLEPVEPVEPDEPDEPDEPAAEDTIRDVGP